jgi:hypothetical protein
MELIEIVKSSLIIFFSLLSVTAIFSYISFKIKDRSRINIRRTISEQVENSPVAGVYPRILTANYEYKISERINDRVSPPRKNIFRYYSFKAGDKMHKLKLTTNR